MNIGQSAIDSIVPDSQSSEIDPEQMQNRGMDVVDLSRILAIQRLVAPFVTLSITDSATNAATGKPIRKAIRIVIASHASLR